VTTGGGKRAVVYFGTGQLTNPTATSGVQYAKNTQSYYGIWDWNMASWNTLSSANPYVAGTSVTVTRSNLLAQSVVSSDPTHRYLSSTNVVCWNGDPVTSACPTENQDGWVFDLPGAGPTAGINAGENEQVIYGSALIQGAVVVNTAIPPLISASNCNPGLQSGFTMAFNPATGGGFSSSFFGDSNGNFGSGSSTVSGVALNGVGTVSPLVYGNKTYILSQTTSGTAAMINTNPTVGKSPSRVSWRELVTP
jgi:type IV pilus assembly protein PilY1